MNFNRWEQILIQSRNFKAKYGSDIDSSGSTTYCSWGRDSLKYYTGKHSCLTINQLKFCFVISALLRAEKEEDAETGRLLSVAHGVMACYTLDQLVLHTGTHRLITAL